MKLLRFAVLALAAVTLPAQPSLSGIPYPNGIGAPTSSLIWVTSTFDGFKDLNTGAVYRVNAADSAILGQHNFPAYAIGVNSPVGVTINNYPYVFLLGSSIDYSADLIQIDANTGTTVNTWPKFIPAGSQGVSPVFDGTYIWYPVAPLAAGPFSLIRFTPATGAVSTFSVPFSTPYQTLASIASDNAGHSYVFADGAISSPGIYAANVDGSQHALYSYPWGSVYWFGSTFDGENFWVVDSKNNAVYTVSPSGVLGGTTIHSIFVNNGVNPLTVNFDGVNLLVTVDYLLYKFNLSGSILNFWETGVTEPIPTFVQTTVGNINSGGALWIADYSSWNIVRVGIQPGT